MLLLDGVLQFQDFLESNNFTNLINEIILVLNETEKASDM